MQPLTAPPRERVAVGRHLLLGGDNIDLTLAQLCEQRMLEGERLDALRFSRLLLACRAAKETLLGPGAPESMPIRVAGLGSALVGGTLSTELSRAQVDIESHRAKADTTVIAVGRLASIEPLVISFCMAGNR